MVRNFTADTLPSLKYGKSPPPTSTAKWLARYGIADGVNAARETLLDLARQKVGGTAVYCALRESILKVDAYWVPPQFVGPDQPMHTGLARYSMSLSAGPRAGMIVASRQGEPTNGIQFSNTLGSGDRRPIWVPRQAFVDSQRVPILPDSIDPQEQADGALALKSAAVHLGAIVGEIEMLPSDSFGVQVQVEIRPIEGRAT